MADMDLLEYAQYLFCLAEKDRRNGYTNSAEARHRIVWECLLEWAQIKEEKSHG